MVRDERDGGGVSEASSAKGVSMVLEEGLSFLLKEVRSAQSSQAGVGK